MERVLGRRSDVLYAVMRIVVGFLFLCHGAQKLLGWFGDRPPVREGLPLVAGVIELGGGLLVLLGLFAGWAAFLCSGLMAVAYFMAHQPQGPLPIQNRGELAALYAFVFLYIASRGSGRLSLDALRRRRG